MKSTFQTKFKDKIRFINKRGLKQTLQSQPSQNEQLPALHKKKNTSISDQADTLKITASKRKFAVHNNNKQSILKKNKTKYNKIATDTTSNLNRSQGYTKTKYQTQSDNNSRDLNHSKSYNENLDSIQFNLSRNPQVQNLAQKLRQKQRERYRQEETKYIDQMIIKHEYLLRMIDTKNSTKWSQIKHPVNLERYKQKQKSRIMTPGKNIRQNQFSLSWNKQDSQIYSYKKQQDISKDLAQIKIKRIQQIINRKNQNRQKQKYSQKPGDNGIARSNIFKIPAINFKLNKQKDEHKKFSLLQKTSSLNNSKIYESQVGNNTIRSNVVSTYSPTK